MLLLTEHPLVRGAVRDAVSARTRIHLCAGWEEVLQEMRRASPRAIVIGEPFRGRPGVRRRDPWGGPAGDAAAELDPGLRRLRTEIPSARVVAVIDSERLDAEGILELGRLGVADVLDIRSETTPAALRARLDGIPPDAFRTLLDGSDLEDLPGRARLLLERAAEVAARGSYPRDLGRRLRLPPRSLRRWTRQAGLPTPRDLFRWLRVLLAASLLDDPGRRVEDVARVSGYARAAGLRRAMRAVLDRPPSRLREEGAYRTARIAFVEEIRRSRSEARA